MPATQSGKTLVSHDTLRAGEVHIPVGSPDWFAWLAQQDAFAYQGKNGHFTARRETRRGRPFWYAYRRRGGKLFKQYLGKPDELTLARLEYASSLLDGQNLFDRYASPPAGAPASGAESRIDRSFLPMTKVSSPALPPHLLSRSRLTRQISTPLAVISAPSGFGKTTLLSDWKQTCGHPVAWLALDEGDNHPTRFWYSVIMALRAVRPGFGEELLGQLRAAAPVALPDFTARLTDQIASCPSAGPRLGLVLDDFQHITLTELYASIQVWLEHLPPNLRLVILGHTKPALSLGGLRARGLLTELDASDLRFTLDEGITYLRQYPHNAPLAYTDLEKLVKHTEGWAAGLTLTAIALGKHQDHRQFIDTFSGAHIYLREYFMETVLQQSSPEVQAFLLKTAILKHLNGDLCDAVTGQSGGAEILARLWQENLFIDGVEEQGWYRYHDLFAEMLRSQLNTRFPDEIEQLHRRAAQWYREQDAPADAIYHLLAVASWDEAAALIETMALRELEQYGEDSRLLRWLQELPEDVVQKHKTLLFVYLRLAEVALPRQSIQRFVEHIEANLSRKMPFQQTQDERDVLVEIQHIRQIWEQGNAFTPPARVDGGNDARWELLNGLHLLTHIYTANPAEFETQAAALLHKAQAQRNLFVALMVGGVLARQAYASGQLRRGEKIARQVLEQALTQRGKLPEPSSIALAVLSQIHLARNDLALAQKYLAHAREVDPNPTSSNMIVQTGILRSGILAAQGKIDEALANLQAVRALHLRRPSGAWTDQDLLAYQALLYIRQGDLAGASQILAEAEATAGHPLSQLARAEIFLLRGQPAAAEPILSALLARYPGGMYTEPLLRVRLLLALALFDQHKMGQALQAMTEAVRLAAPERFIRPFLETSEQCAPLLRLTLTTERHTADAQNFIREILLSAGQAGAYSPSEMQTLSTSASISQREQEVLQLLSSGCSNAAIARQLCISESTVKTHLGSIYHKLGVSSRIQAVSSAKALKLIR